MFSTKTARSALLAAAVSLPATVALAADGTAAPPATPSSVRVERAYAHPTTYAPTTTRYVAVVFKTRGQLPRRSDGLIRAGARFGASSGGSISTVSGKGSRCYMALLKLKDGRFVDRDGSKGPKATAGSQRRLVVGVKDASGKEVTSSRMVTIRRQRAGDRAGKPLDC